MYLIIIGLILLCFVLFMLKMIDRETWQRLKWLAIFSAGLFALTVLLALLAYLTTEH